jgi:hypothetical protein
VLEILNFVFQDGWHFFGCLLLLLIVMAGLSHMFTVQHIHYDDKNTKEKE